MKFLIDLAEKAIVPESVLRALFRIAKLREIAKFKTSYNPQAFKQELQNLSQQFNSNKTDNKSTELPFELFEKLASKNLRISGAY